MDRPVPRAFQFEREAFQRPEYDRLSIQACANGFAHNRAVDKDFGHINEKTVGSGESRSRRSIDAQPLNSSESMQPSWIVSKITRRVLKSGHQNF